MRWTWSFWGSRDGHCAASSFLQMRLKSMAFDTANKVFSADLGQVIISVSGYHWLIPKRSVASHMGLFGSPAEMLTTAVSSVLVMQSTQGHAGLCELPPHIAIHAPSFTVHTQASHCL